MRTYCLISFMLALLLAGCSSPTAPLAVSEQTPGVSRPANMDLSTSQASEQDLFTVSYKSELDPVAINQLHIWTLHVQTADGQAVNGATISIDGGMPAHNHGMPTQPIVTPLGRGDYRAEGMKFHMPGWWTVTVSIDAAGQQDSATFNLMLK
jgi:hypothetical protein